MMGVSVKSARNLRRSIGVSLTIPRDPHPACPSEEVDVRDHRSAARLSLQPRWLVAAGAVVAAACLLTPVASGYAIEVHKDLWDLAFGDRDAGRQATPPGVHELPQLRQFVYQHAKTNPEFKKRWATAASFDAAAFKEFLGLNPGKAVVGIDLVPSSRSTKFRTVLREGSVDPDNDYRNQDRLFLTANGMVVLDAFGRAVPYDPRTTWFGGLTGTPSQFDAHGATLRSGKKGDGLWTALRHPEQFARPPVVLGSAPDFSETYTELAMIAKLSGGPGSEWLSLTLAGNTMHGIEDLGNQIHTTLLGIPEFFLDAKYTHTRLRIKNMFATRKPSAASQGFVAPKSLTTTQVNEAMLLIKAGKEDQVDKQVRFALGLEPKGKLSDTEIGTRIIGNHHRLLEDFVQKQYLEGRDLIASGEAGKALPEVVTLIERAKRGDSEFEKACRAALGTAGLGSNSKGLTPFARVIAETMIEYSAPEAAPIYRATRKVSKKELKRNGVYNDELGHEVLDFVVHKGNEKHIATIWELSGNAFARVVTALRLWDEVFRSETGGVKPGSDKALARAAKIVERLTERQLTYLDAAKVRRDQYLADKKAEWDTLQEKKAKKGFLGTVKAWLSRD